MRDLNLELGQEPPATSRDNNILPDRPQGRRLDVSTLQGEP